MLAISTPKADIQRKSAQKLQAARWAVIAIQEE